MRTARHNPSISCCLWLLLLITTTPALAQDNTLRTINASISVPGERDAYTFTLATPARFYFDALSNLPNTAWSLNGPQGAVVTARGLASSDAQTVADPTVALPAGSYTLTVEGQNASTDNYAFRFVNLAEATPVSTGSVVTHPLSDPKKTDFYSFSAAAGDQFVFQGAKLGLQNTWWRLIGPYGAQVFSTGLNNVGSIGSPITLPVAGVHTLLIEGYIGDTATGNYTFNIVPQGNVPPPAFTGTPLTLGTVISGTFTATTPSNYVFTLAAPARVLFDTQVSSPNMNWTLQGPPGTIVDSRALNSSDWSSQYAPLSLPAGSYQLTLKGTANNSYQFSMLDVASATPITPGDMISGTLNPATAIVLYQFSISAPGEVFYDHLTSSGAPNAFVRLIDPYGNILFNNSLTTDKGPLMISTPGTYLLVVDGYLNDAGSGSYSFKVHNILDGQQALTLGNTVNGTIDTPGQQQRYTFTIPTEATLYFDSLLNNGNFVWSLNSAAGSIVDRRTFNASDAQSVGTPLIPLAPGSYTLTVAANGDNTGSYQFRILDLNSATPLTLGNLLSASLNPANSTTAYKFTGTKGTKVFYNYLTASGADNAYVRLVGPGGNILFSTGLRSDQGPIPIPANGTHTLLVEGYIGDQGTGTYSINLNSATDTTQTLVVGNSISGSLTSPGDTQKYTFALSSSARIYFDSMLNNGNFVWSLDGPIGNLVNRRSFSGSDAQSIDYRQVLLNLTSGNYTLTVSGNGDTTGSYQFRLFDIGTATTVTLGTPVSGSLNPANSTAIYQFNATAGTKVFYNYLTASGGDNAYLRLASPHGNVILNTGLRTDQPPVMLADSGTYTVLAEGYVGDQGTANFSFNLVPVTDSAQVATLGTAVSGSIAVPGQNSRFAFTVPAGARLFFDALTPTCDIRWRIDGPTGNLLGGNNTQCMYTDWIQPQAVTPLPPGGYTVTVVANGDITGPFSFRLVDLSAATTITPTAGGLAVNSAVSPANSLAAWKFTGNAGQQFTLQPITQSGFTVQSAPRWLLQDPTGKVLFDNWFTAPGPIVLPLNGEYYVVVYGWYTETSANANVNFQATLAPGTLLPLTGTPLSPGSVAVGTVSSGSPVFYTFSLPVASRLLFDAQTQNDQLRWSLTNGATAFVANRSFMSSDSAEITDSSLALPSGQYQLAISAASGSGLPFQFNLINFTNATPLTPGTPVVNTLTPGNGTVLYQFGAAAGDSFFFDGQPSSGFTYPPYARLYGPYGNVLVTTSIDADVDTFTVTQSGTYTVAVEGRIYDNHANGTYAFNVVPEAYPTNNLALGSTVAGSIPVLGQRNVYLFSLPDASTLYMDVLTNADFYWRLDAPAGQIVNWRGFSSTDSADGDPVLQLPPGNYTLTVAGSNFRVTGSYQFRLLNLTNSTSFTPGTPVVNELSPANSTVLYRFNGNAGESYYFDGQPTSGFTYAPFMRLYGPFGNALFNPISIDADLDTFTLPQTGTYTIAVEGRVFDTHASGFYSFNLVPEDYPTNNLTLGTLVNDSVPVPGQRNFYEFTLPTASVLYFDSLANADIFWRLDGPSGQVVNWRSFSASDSADIGDPSLRLPAGDYVLTVAGNSFRVIGNYQFRLLNFDSAAPLSVGSTVSATLAPANATTLYRFSASAGDPFYFNGQPASGFTYVPYARLFSPTGNILMLRQADTDQNTFVLPQSGTYILAIEGRVFDAHPSGNYAFSLVPNPVLEPQPLFGSGGPAVTLDSARIDGDVFRFSFTSTSGLNYDVQFATSLSAPVTWQPLTNFIGDGSIFTVTDQAAATGAGFYRVQIR